jgi:hypothetical protein
MRMLQSEVSRKPRSAVINARFLPELVRNAGYRAKQSLEEEEVT